MSVKDPAHVRNFKRREKAALAGLHLPTEDELLRGMSFFKGDVSEDIREYATRLSGALKTRCDLGLAGLIAALDRLSADQNEHTVQNLMAAFGVLESLSHASFESGGVRCQLYLGIWGHPNAAARIAGQIAALALKGLRRSDDLELLWRSLAWSAFSSSIQSQGYGLSTWHRSGPPRILEHLYIELGYDPRWAAPLDQIEADALDSAWPGGSIRKLQRLVEKLVEVRETAMKPHRLRGFVGGRALGRSPIYGIRFLQETAVCYVNNCRTNPP